jgi:hypothetical protein
MEILVAAGINKAFLEDERSYRCYFMKFQE